MCYTQHIMLHYVDCRVCSKVCYQFWERELSGGKGRKFGSDEESEGKRDERDEEGDLA